MPVAIADDDLKSVLGRFAALTPTEPGAARLKDLRRGRHRPPRMIELALIERQGVVTWEFGHAFSRRPIPASGRRAGRRAAVRENVLFVDRSEPLGVNQIGKYLLDFDHNLNGDIDRLRGWNLRQWDNATEKLVVPVALSKPGPVLVIVHGTASNCSHIIDELRAAPNGSGKKLMADAAKHYAAVLAFDHPTLAFSPMINALDLSKALEPYDDRAVDVICHSRGGLVSSWWMHLVDQRPRVKRCVFVGSPLQGTSLASPARLRASLNLLATYGRLLSNLGQATGFLTLPFAILKVVSAAADITARTPLLDAGLAMIPGLNAQSRVDNNTELSRLNARPFSAAGAPSRFFIQANFESPDPGWRIWQYARPMRAAEAAVDLLVFTGKNDLVVDTESMIDTGGGPTHVFENPADGVHHTNYFRQEVTTTKVREWLGIPI